MNYLLILSIIGKLLFSEGILLTVPLAVALLSYESPIPFLIPFLVLVTIGLLLMRIKPKSNVLYAKDGFVIVASAWFLMSLFGAIPFILSGDIPRFVDALFETISGFTTTGSTILTDVESLSRGGLFWRSFTHWIGGMGVLVFVMAVLPMNDGHGMHILRAEMPGPTVGKLVSRIGDTAKILYLIYFVMTLVLIVLLMFGGMSLFDACIHALGTAGTGGFSSRALSIGAYDSAYVDIVTSIFMLLFGVNFNLYYLILLKRVKEAFHSEEMLTYFAIVAASTLAIAFNIRNIYGSSLTCLRHAFFQVSSIITTTGYSTVDFNTWPVFSKCILVVLMFIGGCAGSTAGGLKVIRICVLLKTSISDFKKILYPKTVSIVRIDGKVLSESFIRQVHTYFFVYSLIFTLSVIFLSIEGFDIVTTFTAVASGFNNIGPGLELVGPMGSFADFSDIGKLLISFDMLAGRLEIYPLFIFFSKDIWKNILVRKRTEISM